MKTSSKRTRGSKARRIGARKSAKTDPQVLQLRETLATFKNHPAAVTHVEAPPLPDDFIANRDYYLHGACKKYPRRGRWLGNLSKGKPFTAHSARDFIDKCLELAAQVTGLPADLAKNHNHYLHGHPKL